MKKHLYNKKFPWRAPQSFLAKINPVDPKDPLLLQVLPSELETKSVPGYQLDPLNECGAQKIPGLLHKYHGRVLLMVVNDCPIHCRFCFRRHFQYPKNVLQRSNWQRILKYLAQNKIISEVILSGGEPLLLSASKLQSIIGSLAAISHLKYLRIHTRLPIAMPEKITDNLVQAIISSRLKPVIVMHSNHPNELDPKVQNAIAKFTTVFIPVLSQSVLLKGINDSAATLVALSTKLFGCGVMPYYLHLLDKVAGSAHFSVSLTRARRIMRELRATLPGYLVPRLVREKAGKDSKTVIV